jgi:hypothetical protein
VLDIYRFENADLRQLNERCPFLLVDCETLHVYSTTAKTALNGESEDGNCNRSCYVHRVAA